MTLESLTLQNFKRYADYKIEFESGLCGILGRNGRGKSTIFDGVFFALYGEYKGSKELIPTAGSTGSVKVELNFAIDDKSYTVIREFRGKALTAYASLKEGERALATGAKEVSNSVTKLLGMGKEAFLHTVFASQKELTALSSMKNDERKTMMRRLLGLEKIDKIEEMIREELRELNRELKSASAYLLSDDILKQHRDDLKIKTETALTLDKRIQQLNDEATALKTVYESAKIALDAHQKSKEEWQKKLQQLDKLQQALALQQKQLTTLDEELKSLHSQQSHYTAQLPLKTRFEVLEKSLLEQESLKASYLKKEGLEKEQEELRKSYTVRKEEVAQLSKEIEPLETLKAQLVHEQNHFTTVKTSFETLTEYITNATAQITANRTNIANVQAKVEKITELGTQSPCPICTRPLLENYDTVLSSLHHEIIDIYQKQIDETQNRLTTLNDQKVSQQKVLIEAEASKNTTDKHIALLLSKTQDLIKAQERFQEVETRGLANKAALAQLGTILYDEKVHTTLKGERDTLKPQVDTLIALEALIATIPTKTTAAQKLREQIQTDTQSITSQQKIIAEESYSEKNHTDATLHVKTAETEKDAKGVELNTALLEQTNIRRDIEAIDKEIKRDETNRTALKTRENDQADYEKLKAVMSEFKTHINARVAPRIGEVASEMYSRITRGRYQHIEVSPEFDFYIYDNGERYPIERFSGGEIDLANLVLRIAISKTLGELSGGGNIGFLAFDEVFGSQDEQRRIQIMEAFHTISESYRQIFLISHETEIKEMFERVVEL
ncbi:MAG: SMC family ATPase [Campylobacterales bacterium]|nr:SMC family ATPase [Campylobacterales bacterium]